jgi:putative protein-disulfide isomerase
MPDSRLVYVMDPMCSWCWGFAPVAQALIAQAGAAGVDTRLMLGGLRSGAAASLDATKRAYILKHWAAVAELTGQPFRFDDALPSGFLYDTEPACRAVVVARLIDESRALALSQAIQKAFYVEGLDVTRPPTLLHVAEAAGLPRREFAELFDSQAAVDATQRDFAWVQDLGIAGFPTLLAQHNGQTALLTNGYQSLPELAPLLARWLERAAHP